MAPLTKRHRILIERHLARTRERDGHIIMTHRRPRTTGITRHEFHELLDRASQPIKSEQQWWDTPSINHLSSAHLFSHARIRQSVGQLLISLGATNESSILELGCGTGETTQYLIGHVTGLDCSHQPLKRYTWPSVEADATHLPFKAKTFDFVVISALLHHLGKDIRPCLCESQRVCRAGGYVVALEPNAYHPSGILMNICNTIKPGITGLVPHERALIPHQLMHNFRRMGLSNVTCVAASYVWNRLPMKACQWIAHNEEPLRRMTLSRYWGWFSIIYGQKLQG